MTKMEIKVRYEGGGRLFFACSGRWEGACELARSAQSNVWVGTWCDSGENIPDVLEYKCFAETDGGRVWEQFEGNRAANMKWLRRLPFPKLRMTFSEKEECIVCECAVSATTVLCQNFHKIDFECFLPYVTAAMEGKRTDFSCMECQAILSEDTYIDLLPPNIAKRYNRTKLIESGVEVQTCPNVTCEFYVAVSEGDAKLRTYKCEECDQSWCARCNKQVEGECLICVEGLQEVADQIEAAIGYASGTTCPSCNQSGQKEESECTHISCSCGVFFCYCCGRSSDDIDSTDPFAEVMDKFYGHNNDWQIMDERCPMYLSEMSEMYTNWPCEMTEQQTAFHGLRAGKELLQLQQKVEKEVWEKLMSVDKRMQIQIDEIMKIYYEII